MQQGTGVGPPAPGPRELDGDPGALVPDLAPPDGAKGPCPQHATISIDVHVYVGQGGTPRGRQLGT